ncbi:helix-turn-helix domain-containing protein [Pseudoteredinibacter isoporae]|nr:helix-turn-helix domain-containing protein [Pseudoteredinibacter isoporae]NIB23960.1 helix-turn-helix domain-containing protein [Pseudoteredinibacter isoporae]
MSIGEVSKRTGIAASALRYYEERGLITPVGRQAQKRLYHPTVTERLALITLGQNAGFSLDDIAEVLTSTGFELDRAQLTEKANELEQQIQRLTVMRDGLLHAAKCTAPSHAECPSFQKLLRITQKKKIQASQK